MIKAILQALPEAIFLAIATCLALILVYVPMIAFFTLRDLLKPAQK